MNEMNYNVDIVALIHKTDPPYEDTIKQFANHIGADYKSVKLRRENGELTNDAKMRLRGAGGTRQGETLAVLEPDVTLEQELRPYLTGVEPEVQGSRAGIFQLDEEHIEDEDTIESYLTNVYENEPRQ